MSRKLLLLIATITTSLAGCGGGGGGGGGGGPVASSNSTGYFIDAPVSGASYRTSSGLSGTTQADGSFSFKSGDTVDFTVLGVSLSSAAGNTGGISIPASGIVTPFTISGETPSLNSTNAPIAAAIASFLQTLSDVSSGSSSASSSAVLLIPSGATASTLTATFAQQAASSGSTLIQTIASNLPSLVGSGNSGGVVTTTAALASAYNVALASAGSQSTAGQAYANSVWTLSNCSTGSCNLYAVLLPNGTVAGVNTNKNGMFGGYWIASGGSLTIHLQGAAGSADVTLSAGASSSSSVTITGSSGSGSTGSATITEITSSSGAESIANSGLWYANYTPASSSSGNSAGQGIFVLAPNGTLVGITSGSSSLAGTWSGSTGTLSPSGGGTCTLNLSTLAGACTGTGGGSGTLALSRQALPAPAYSGAGSSGSGSSTTTTLSGTWTLNCPNCAVGSTGASTAGSPSSGTYTATIDSSGNITIDNTVTTEGAAGGLPTFTGTVSSSGAVSATAGAGTNCASTLMFSLNGQVSGSSLSFSVSRPQGPTATGSGTCEAEYGTGGAGATTSYAIGGTASFGASGNCVAISLADATINASNILSNIQVGPGCNTPVNFQFPASIASGDSYQVTIPSNQPIAPNCAVANGSGVASANISNVTITCN